MKKSLFCLFVTIFTSSTIAAMPQMCQDYHKEIDNFIVKMKEMGTAEAQINVMQRQYDSSKQKISALSVIDQEGACKKSMDALRQSMAAIEFLNKNKF
ncbi:DUF5339 domain-containing protein [Escherichia coli]|nr:DUF5339 domain-containing protein [Escherichia coli]